MHGVAPSPLIASASCSWGSLESVGAGGTMAELSCAETSVLVLPKISGLTPLLPSAEMVCDTVGSGAVDPLPGEVEGSHDETEGEERW